VDHRRVADGRHRLGGDGARGRGRLVQPRRQRSLDGLGRLPRRRAVAAGWRKDNARISPGGATLRVDAPAARRRVPGATSRRPNCARGRATATAGSRVACGRRAAPA
jgi:hypothetical protein